MSNPDDIVTRCPQCNTAFRVTLNQLAVADGQVRCGSCLAVFKAVDHDALKETTPKTSVSRPPATQKEAFEAAVAPKTSIADSLKAAMGSANKFSNTQPIDTDTDTDTSKSFKTTANTQEMSSVNAEVEELTVQKTEIKQPESHSSTQSKPPSEPKPEPEKFSAPDLDDELVADDNKQSKLDLDGDIFDVSSEHNTKTSLFDRKLNEEKEHSRESADESWAVRMLAELEDEENEGKTHFITESKPQALKSKKNDLNDNYEVKIEPSQVLDEDLDAESDANVNSSFDSIDLNIGLDTDNESEGIDNNEDESALNFDYDDIYDDVEAVNDTSSLDSAHDSKVIKEPEQHKSISDDEIETAMSSRARYQDDAKSYLANIEPAPVEMMDFSSPSAQRWLWRAGAIIAGLLLLIQIAVIRFDNLSKDPSYRPIYNSACKIVGCVLPPLIDTQKIRTTNLIVRSHPRLQNALIIDAILINNAKFSQAFPALQLDFNDINDKLIASRQLQPDEYLRGELAGAKQMANNQPIQLSIEIVDPGDAAVNYQLTVVQARPKDNKN